MIRVLISLALVLLALSVLAQQCPRGTLIGNATHVRDGDTIEVGGMPIRLQGLAAPERGDPGEAEAIAAMHALVIGRELWCQLDGEVIAAALVRAGLARDCPRFSGWRYVAAERQAAADGATIGREYVLPGYCRAR